MESYRARYFSQKLEDQNKTESKKWTAYDTHMTHMTVEEA